LLEEKVELKEMTSVISAKAPTFYISVALMIVESALQAMLIVIVAVYTSLKVSSGDLVVIVISSS
jgi:hypothetical protein